MWKELKQLFSKDSLCEEAFNESLDVLRECLGMYNDAIASLQEEKPLKTDIYKRDRKINKFERAVRRKIVTHLAISTNPDVPTSLVLTSVVIDIERIGDYTKNIVELAFNHPGAFAGGELRDDVLETEVAVRKMFNDLIPALDGSDLNRARRVIADQQAMAGKVDRILENLVAGKTLAGDSGEAVTAALLFRYLKRIGAHLKNVATSVVNPYYRIGYREKNAPGDENPPETPPPSDKMDT